MTIQLLVTGLPGKLAWLDPHRLLRIPNSGGRRQNEVARQASIFACACKGLLDGKEGRAGDAEGRFSRRLRPKDTIWVGCI